MPVAVEPGERSQRRVVCIADLPAEIEAGQPGQKVIDGLEPVSPGREVKQTLNPRVDLIWWQRGIPGDTHAASLPKGFFVQSATGGVEGWPMEAIRRSCSDGMEGIISSNPSSSITTSCHLPKGMPHSTSRYRASAQPGLTRRAGDFGSGGSE